MRRLIIVLCALVFLLAGESFAATTAKKKKPPAYTTVTCPAAITNPILEEYVSLPKNIRCISETRPSSKAKLSPGALCDVGDSSSAPPQEWPASGSGQLSSQTPTFWVTNKPRAIVYSFDGGTMDMALYDAETKRKVASYASVKAPVSETKSYINIRGHFYIGVAFAKDSGYWQIDLLDPDED